MQPEDVSEDRLLTSSDPRSVSRIWTIAKVTPVHTKMQLVQRIKTKHAMI